MTRLSSRLRDTFFGVGNDTVRLWLVDEDGDAPSRLSIRLAPFPD